MTAGIGITGERGNELVLDTSKWNTLDTSGLTAYTVSTGTNSVSYDASALR